VTVIKLNTGMFPARSTLKLINHGNVYGHGGGGGDER
jgi:hypothetical protein